MGGLLVDRDLQAAVNHHLEKCVQEQEHSFSSSTVSLMEGCHMV